MAFLLPPPAQGLPEGAYPYQFIANQVTASGHTWSFTQSIQYCTAVITGIDVTVTQTSPLQTYCEMSLNNSGAIFFHDSQSIGEGLGVSYFYRGALPIQEGDELVVKWAIISGSGPAPSGCVAYGYVLPMEQIF